MNILDTKIQYYPAKIYETKPLGELTVRQLILSQRDPKDRIKKVFDDISRAEKEGNMELKAELKTENLFYTNPAVYLNGKGRKYTDIVHFTGIAPLDFDHLEDAHEFRDIIFNRFNCVITAFLSPSRKGVKFLVRIPVCQTVEEYKSYVYGLAFYFERFKGFDPSIQNAVLPLFLSWDKDIRWREDAKVWIKRGEKLSEFKEYEGDFETVKEVSNKDKGLARWRVARVVAKADLERNGHPNVRGASLLMGGYCAAGYLSEEEGYDYLIECIEASDYLKKGLAKYRKTAQQMFKKGLRAPLYLDNDD